MNHTGKEYSRVKTRFLIADIFLSGLFLAAFQFFFSVPASAFAGGISGNFCLKILLYSSIFAFFMYMTGLPLHFANSFLVEKRFNLTERTFGSWLLDEAKGAALSYSLWILSVEVFYLVLRNFPVMWWLILTALWILFTIVLTRFLPVMLLPIFYRYSPIEDKALRERILALAAKSGIKLMDICQIDFSKKTKKANAALIGLGKTRKVVFADTLLKEFTPDEAESVLAHEFGHHKYSHTAKLLVFSALVTTAAFFILSRTAQKIAHFAGYSDIMDVSLLPVLIFLMTVFSLFLLPAQNFLSRCLEREADSFALDVTARPDVFISVMNKLARMNLSDTNPSRLKKIFFYSHPPISERIVMARKWMDEKRSAKDNI